MNVALLFLPVSDIILINQLYYVTKYILEDTTYISRGGEFKLLIEIIKCYGHQMYVPEKNVIVILPLNSERACLFHWNLETLIYTGPQDPTFL